MPGVRRHSQVEEAGGAGQDEEHSAESNLCHDGVVMENRLVPEEENPVGAGPPDQVEPRQLRKVEIARMPASTTRDIDQRQSNVRKVGAQQGWSQERADYAQERDDDGLVAQGQQRGQRTTRARKSRATSGRISWYSPKAA